MSTKLNNFHLSSECRSILYRLLREIEFQLDKDICEGFSGPSCVLGNLLPLIYQAFIKLWCHKIPLIVKKFFYTSVSNIDVRHVRIPYAYFQELLKSRSDLLLRQLSSSFSDKTYEQAVEDILYIIDSRLSELQGDAQPTPILRLELSDLVEKFKLLCGISED